MRRSTRLIVIRHGETYLNAKKVHQGQLQGSLNPKGRSQASELAKTLKPEKIDVIYSSDLRRAIQTSKIIAKYHKAPIIYDKDLRERHMGVFQGRPRSETAEMRASGKDFKPKGGESDADQVRRTRRFLTRMRREKNLEGMTVLVSGHAGTAWCMTAILTKVPLHKVKKMGQRTRAFLYSGLTGSPPS